MVGADQLLNIRLFIPLIFLSNVASAVAIYLWPDFFLVRHGHFILIAAQGVGLLIYLAYVIRTYIHLAPLIAQTREEWSAAAEK
jgi:hypothetical protein